MKRSKSIFRKIFIPVSLILILQILIFLGAIIGGGVIDNLRYYAGNELRERVSVRANELETQFSLKWTNLRGASDELHALLDDMDISTTQLMDDEELQKNFLGAAGDTLVRTLRQNGINGVFLILNSGEQSRPVGSEQHKKYGLGLRDLDPSSSYIDREDLLIQRAPSSLAVQLECPLDGTWEPYYSFTQDSYNDYFYQPVEAAYQNFGAQESDLAYLSAPHRLSASDPETVSYSIPLLDKDGKPFAVLGIELTTAYITSLLPAEELYGQNNGAYIIAASTTNSDEYQIYAQSGIFASRCFGSDTVIEATDILDGGVYTFKSRDGATVTPCGGISNITVYNKNTPFENQQIALIGIVSEEELNSMTDRILHMLAIAVVLSLTMSVFGVIVVCRLLSQPITELSDKVSGDTSGASLEHIGITEIDRLTDSIVKLNARERESLAKTEFFARMSHDMRTPMNAIIGFSGEELVSDADEQKKTEYLQRINESAKYLLGLINEVLDMSKIEREKMQLNYEPVQVDDFWRSTLPIIDEIAKQRGIDFDVKISGGELVIIADRQRMQQIAVNLLSNAVKFTPEGGRVTLRAEHIKRGGSKVESRFVIADNGMGMSAEFMDKMYIPFEQENPSNGEGTGLGLPICKRLVELMGGKIECQSAVGDGTTFTVTLVNELTDEEPVLECSAKAKTAAPNDSLKGKRILVCEDHPLNTQIAVKLLERAGCLVECAENGSVGVDKFSVSKAGYYSAVLMDIRMPVMNGLDAARAIRALDHPDAKRVPIIAMTANAFEEDVKKSRASGMNAHLSKPISPQVLYGTLAEFIM